MTTEYTPNFRFNLPDFRMGPWHDLTNTNTTRIDQLLMSIYQGVDTSPWMNNTLYTPGETAVDPNDNSFWVCIVQHTSAPVPTTFAADRAAHPGYWNRVVVGISPRGQWTNSTHYLVNDMVTDAIQGVLAVCITEHTSNASGTIRDDHVYWSFIADISGNPVMEASFIDYDDSTGYTGSTNVDGALDYLASVTHTQGTTIATHTTQIANNTTNIATNATNIAAEKTRNDTQDGLIAANTVAISSKISEAPNDAKQYARQSLGWHEVTGFPEAPIDGKKYARSNAAWTEVGDAAVLVSDTPPASPKDNTLWWESDSGMLYIRYNDGDSAQWVVAVPQLDAAAFASTAYVDAGDAALASAKVGKTGDIMTGQLEIKYATPTILLNKTATSGQDAALYGMLNGKGRWLVDLGNGVAESGGNVGSDFGIHRYNDDGSYNSSVLAFSRLTGVATFTYNAQFNGAVSVTGNITSLTSEVQAFGGSFRVRAANSSANAHMWFDDEAGANKAIFYWERSANRQLMVVAGQQFAFNANGIFTGGVGYTCKAGNGGAYGGNNFNLMYNAGPCQLWIDNTNLGNISVTCDYRTKKDVEDLPSTWDKVKAMRPVCFTQAEAFGGLFAANNIKRWGFIAHELQEDLIPSAATGYKDEENVVQSPDLMAVIAALTKSLQEAMERIEALEAR